MRCYILLALCAVVALQLCEARQLGKCQIVHELRRQRFPENKMRDWVCLIEHESLGRTNVVGPANSDGSHDYGLFQINDRYWCSNTNRPGKECHVTCSELLTDDITKAARCAKKIYSVHGFYAWYGWVNHCRGRLPDISKC